MSNQPITTYTIRLQPVDQYFFGGETHHEIDNRRQYFHRSNPYPQQTALLGMIRHQLLLQEGLLPLNNNNATRAGALIGQTGFNGQSQSYGVIAGISPLRWLKGGKVYDLRSFEWLCVDEKPQKPVFHWESKMTPVGGLVKGVPILEFQEKNRETGAPEPKSWTAKTHFSDQLAHDDKHHIALENVVMEKEQVGIWKDREGKAKEEGYFKFVYQRLAPDWSFVFSLSVYNQLDRSSFAFDTTRRIITMGAERSAFLMEVLPQAPDYPTSVTAKNGTLQKVTLTSDAYVDNEQAFYGLVNFPLCAATPFRYNESVVKAASVNYSDLPTRSKRFLLLKRGSVFYTDQAATLATTLENQSGYYTIGYNHFLIENP